ncbi:uncharacterized protein L3040_009291 [Drepanopeziza brunnea f. sp. 'multigermtubi']|uniref:Copper transport protein n=1 Tax=Marssonina brunnea f. sp. multigermtubi (strain MB_m1) TaxID=1072389 RepID=K1Y297_MARBU|nr:Ctr copper transporter family protein [Drepanopeziza brunnea f. sp. 'multigermtubi' MB_m1]EKD19269.1 Ctr copper transporter family protein [Drepanopeziza brunnea f. sp. 'multigermtubi' MB_m1]KAJ5032696.1 hypothetical protein L3040_009291 [Drepanopeziza brunnea f. sp. 'multigermtubi']
MDMNMDMSSTTMPPSMATPVSSAAAATSSAAMDMGGMAGMDHSGMDMGGCITNMLWNWNVIDSCFISSSWRITSKGMFAGSCIGVILLVMSVEFLRRLCKEYDRYILRQHQRTQAVVVSNEQSKATDGTCAPDVRSLGPVPFRPNLLQQSVRATLHMCSFAAAYFVMLLAMYYNGYIIMCIFIGAWLGAFVFSWETIGLGGAQREENVTGCCG